MKYLTKPNKRLNTSQRTKRKAIRYWVVERGQKRCSYCCKQLHYTCNHPQQATVEHIIPQSEVRKNNVENLLVCCLTCNRLRGNTYFPNFVYCNNFPKTEWLISKYKKARGFR